MKPIIIILKCLIVYLLSCHAVYKHTQRSYSNGGTLSEFSPDTGDVFAMFIPVFNTFAALILWIAFPTKIKKKKDYKKFFKIKK